MRTDEKKRDDTAKTTKRPAYRTESEGRSTDRPWKTDEKKKSGINRTTGKSAAENRKKKPRTATKDNRQKRS